MTASDRGGSFSGHASDGGRITVLHVDDDPEFLELASTLLEREAENIAVETVTSGAAALDRLDDGDVDCVVSDHDMPGRTGIELLREVRKEHDGLPFILFTGNGSEEVAGEAIMADATDYLQKNVGGDTYALLANRVENAVAGYRARQEAARQRRINSLIRTVNARLVEADSRTEIERAVCDAISSSDHYRFAWIGEPDLATGRIVPRTSGGEADRYLDEITVRCDDSPRGHGPAGRAVRTQETQVVQDIASDPAFEPWYEHTSDRGFGSVIVLPLESDADLHGILAIYAGQTDVFTPAERTVLEELAGTIAEAIEAAAAKSDLVERESELRDARKKTNRLHSVARELSECTSVEGVCARTADAANDILAFEMCVVTIKRDAGLVVEADVGVPPNGSDTMSVEEGIAGKTYRTGEAYLIQDIDGHPDAQPQDGAYRSAISVPIGDHGVFQAVAKDFGEFDERDLELAELLVSHTDAALTRVADRQRLREREQQLQTKVDRLDGFASIVSHDLRTPLNTLLGALELAEETGDPEHFDRCRRAIDRMDRLIENLLALSRETDPVDDKDLVDVGRVARECWEGLETSNGTLQVAAHKPIAADLQLLRQLLENLLTNALQHGGDRVTVTVGAIEGEDGFYVADDGPGIPADMRDTVFEAGYTTAPDGTGFGLTIVDRIAEAHDWQVSVTETPDGGSRFEIAGSGSVAHDAGSIGTEHLTGR